MSLLISHNSWAILFLSLCNSHIELILLNIIFGFLLSCSHNHHS